MRKKRNEKRIHGPMIIGFKHLINFLLLFENLHLNVNKNSTLHRIIIGGKKLVHWYEIRQREIERFHRMTYAKCIVKQTNFVVREPDNVDTNK